MQFKCHHQQKRLKTPPSNQSVINEIDIGNEVKQLTKAFPRRRTAEISSSSGSASSVSTNVVPANVPARTTGSAPTTFSLGFSLARGVPRADDCANLRASTNWT